MSGTVEFRRQTTISKVVASDPFQDLITDGHTKAWYIWNEGYTLDGSGVTALNDQSGNGYHLAPTNSTGGDPTSDNYPIWHSTNGITFDGTDDVLKATMSGWTTFGSLYIVCTQRGWSNSDTIIGYAGTGATRISQALSAEGGSPNIHAVHSSGQSLAITTFDIDEWGILTLHVNSTTPICTLKFNNGSTVTNETSMTGFTSAGIILGAIHAAPPNLQRYSNVSIKEVIVRDVVDGTTDEGIIYDYLSDKYSIG